MAEKMYVPTEPAAPLLLRPVTIAFLLVATVVLYCVPQSMAEPDIWWHLRDAQLQLASHSFLTRDLFSYTAAGAPWMDHEWLAELPFYAGYHLFGAAGVFAVTLLALEFIFCGLLYLAYARSGSIAASTCATIIGLLLATVSFGPRTLLFGWVLLIVELILLQLSERYTRLAWTLPVVFLLWVNTHGSWLIGIVVFALYVLVNFVGFASGSIENRAAERRGSVRLATSWALSVAMLFVNPYGWRLVFYPFDLAFRQKLNVGNVEEWKSLDFHTPRGRILFLVLAALFLLQLLRGRRWDLFELAITAMGIYAGLTYSRFLFLAAILAVPSLAASLARPAAMRTRRGLSPLMSAALVFLIGGMIVGRVRAQRSTTLTMDEGFPVKALGYLTKTPHQGHILNDYAWGGYLIWNEHGIPVFIDSRVDIFEYNGTFKDYLDLTHLKDSFALLDKYRIRYVLFKRDAPLVYLLKNSQEWKVDYEDEGATLLERIGDLPPAANR